MIRKQVKPAELPLEERREAEYPAYPLFPARILQEVDLLRGALYEALPQVRVPALLIHSRADASVKRRQHGAADPRAPGLGGQADALARRHG